MSALGSGNASAISPAPFELPSKVCDTLVPFVDIVSTRALHKKLRRRISQPWKSEKTLEKHGRVIPSWGYCAVLRDCCTCTRSFVTSRASSMKFVVRFDGYM